MKFLAKIALYGFFIGQMIYVSPPPFEQEPNDIEQVLACGCGCKK